jgi:hypothetical protein
MNSSFQITYFRIQAVLVTALRMQPNHITNFNWLTFVYKQFDHSSMSAIWYVISVNSYLDTSSLITILCMQTERIANLNITQTDKYIETRRYSQTCLIRTYIIRIRE